MAKTKTKKNAGWGVAHIPVTSWILFWTLVLATMALAAVCFSSAFIPKYVSDDQATVAAYKAIADNLEKQVNEMEAKQDTQAPTSAEGDACLQDTPSPIDNYVTYVDQKTSVSVKLPFGTGWLNEQCIFAPAYVSNSNFSFGPYVKAEDFPIRDSHLSVLQEKRTVAEERAKLKNPQEGTITNLREQTISGIAVFSYTLELVGPPTKHWVALGRNYTYFIYSNGWLTDAEAVKIIQSLRVVK